MTATMKLLGAKPAGGAEFNPETDITWHSLFWAEGTDFQAEGYSDTNEITSWLNEAGEANGTVPIGAKPTYVAAESTLNNQPAVRFTNAPTKWVRVTYNTPPSYAAGVSYVLVVSWSTIGQYRGFLSSTSDKNLLYAGGAVKYSIYASGSVRSGSAWPSSGAALMVAYFDGSTGSDKLWVNGALEVDANAGSGQATDMSFGALMTNNYSIDGAIPMCGVYEGNITAHGSFTDLETWAEDHYGLTIA